MQDNYSNIDDEFLESGWAQMRTLLDKEMPVKEERRTYFWFFTSAILVVSLVAFFVWKQNDEIPTQATDSNAIPVASLIQDKVPVNTAPTGEKVLRDEILPIHESSMDVLAETLSAKDNIGQKPSVNEYVISQDITRSVAALNRSEQYITKQNKSFNQVASSFVSNEIAKPGEVLNSQRKILEDYTVKSIASSDLLVSSVKSIPGLQINQLPTYENKISALSLNEPVKFNQTSPLSLGVQASYVLGNMLAYEGASVGVFSKYKLSRRFSIKSGFDLSFFKSQHNLKSWFRNNDNALVLRERIITKGASSAAEILKSVDKSLLVELPIEVDYKLFSKFSISGGLKLGYLLNAAGDNLHLSDDNPPSVKINDTYPLDEGFIQRPYLSVKSGAHYSLTDQINLDVSYTQSLGSFVSSKASIENENYDRNISNNRKNSFSYLTMGLSYDF